MRRTRSPARETSQTRCTSTEVKCQALVQSAAMAQTEQTLVSRQNLEAAMSLADVQDCIVVVRGPVRKAGIGGDT